eukprot:TRINITY_DN3080_c0_g1_i1.p1 TRINITY_DN3080_c0_g1~~TRINITY_DN3080_c0_g1_i1.p1  ORF type:complete len:212 (+),score=76.64 TRINITY_DN3080_c0_g1_i1:31-666(+)
MGDTGGRCMCVALGGGWGGAKSATTFIVDEAYHEFGVADKATGAPQTCARLASRARNVVVTRTFSKAFCLASLRCGYLVAHPNTCESLKLLYNPKSVNQVAQVAALCALREWRAYYAPYVAATVAARDEFVARLRARGVAVGCGGGGNFACVRVPDGGGVTTAALCAALERSAIFVRDINARFPGYVRVTIGLDMTRVVDAILAALGKAAT